MTRLIGLITVFASRHSLAVNPEAVTQDRTKHLGFGNTNQHKNLRDPSSRQIIVNTDEGEVGDGVTHLCHHCGHYCGGHCQGGGGNNLNVALVPDQSKGGGSSERPANLSQEICEEDPVSDDILINGVVDDQAAAKKAEDDGARAQAAGKAEQRTEQATQTRDQAALDDQAYSIESRLEDFQDVDDTDVADIEAKDAEDAKEAGQFAIEESLEDLKGEESIEEEEGPPIANEIQESLDVIDETQNALSEDLSPIISPDSPKNQEVFCDEVADEANKAAKLKSEIKKESDDLKLQEAEHKLETDSSAAEEALSKERSQLAEE